MEEITISNQLLSQQLMHLQCALASWSNPDLPSIPTPSTKYPPLERGRMYQAYSEKREAKLQEKHRKAQAPAPSRPMKQVSFGLETKGALQTRKDTCILDVARSVPDFGSALRKENKKPLLPSSMTPPPPQKKSCSGWGSRSEEKKGVSKVSKSYANIKDLRGFSTAAAQAINGEDGVGTKSCRGRVGSGVTGIGSKIGRR
ncbi:hypothetical protein AMTRI_Chr02g215160 [Amborella trichopoda]|uniref:Uncharacterized protein n=1 Tax=Amborella trichopoda TaxID=13333 RepID=U5DE67_AMBTC|nr:uncharacterized protein LOC18448112 [Amborella trichopoda]ERN19717.1 hypothetical protein AMTR_s00062p00203790 [Amborella trichopoda]|eukprot:XP_006858250.3 uncharacterized protein LOC18448112 [Amborella trichopoda]